MLPSAELIARHNTPGPRYTSYPTAPSWDRRFPDAELGPALARLSGPASVYVHVPFCKEQCLYCGCTMAVAGRQVAGDRYLDALQQHLDDLPLPAEAWPVERLHFGGGTPTWLSPEQLDRLFDLVARRFVDTPHLVRSLEADPAVTTEDHLDLLAERGLHRLSLGVQSFDPVVLEAVQRPQQAERIAALVDGARARGITRINLDLMYGLPHQTLARFDQTLTRTLALRPDRLALFGYAHVPWLKKHQEKLEAEALPGPMERLRLLLHAQERLLAAGYKAIGMDHFALADDPLSIALTEGRLGRDFMGYTTRATHQMVGLGMSAISELPDHYLQERMSLGRWYAAVAGRDKRIEKGMRLTPEDRLRRDVIMGIMCNLRLRTAEVEQAHAAELGGQSFREHFATEWAELKPLADDGLVVMRADGFDVTELGRLLVRNVARVFDGRIRASRAARFSAAV